MPQGIIILKYSDTRIVEYLTPANSEYYNIRILDMQKVRVYWNLHKKCWSIQDCKSGLVVDHKDKVVLEIAKFVVRKGGQDRVRKEGKKNVHAFAVGYLADDQDSMIEFPKYWRIKYNPYTDNYFKQQGCGDNQYKEKEWDYVNKDFIGTIYMESTENYNHKVYI